jgi:anti-sigma factor RsiW
MDEMTNEMSEMTCREVSAFLMSYLDGELGTAQKEEFETHLRLCEDCVAYLDGYRKTIDLGKAAFPSSDEPVQGLVPEQLVRAILSARGKKP